MRIQFGKLLRNTILLIAAGASLGTALLILVFCLPVDRMKQHVAASMDEVLQDAEQVPGGEIFQYIQAKRESYTDSIMVQNAVDKVPGKNIFEHTMWMYHHDLEEEFWTPEASLKVYCGGGDTDGMYLHEYSRYWHGYLVYLKPLFLLLDWKQLTGAGVLLQLLLMAAVTVLAVRKKYPGVAVAMLAGFLFMKPLLVLVSLAMTVCWVIILAALLFMLLKGGWLREKGWYPEFFLTVGILTAYFDFLSYPVATLGFPLCAYFLLDGAEYAAEAGNYSGVNPFKGIGRRRAESLADRNWGKLLRALFQEIFVFSACWGIGYAGMWAMKWIIADLALHTGTVKDAIWSVIGRTEAIGGRPRLNGGFYVIGLNLQEYDSMVYPVLAAAIALVSLILVAAACRKKGMARVLVRMVPYMVIFCIPFVWIIAVQHHSALHARFTFRILALAVLAVAGMGCQAVREMKKE